MAFLGQLHILGSLHILQNTEVNSTRHPPPVEQQQLNSGHILSNIITSKQSAQTITLTHTRLE